MSRFDRRVGPAAGVVTRPVADGVLSVSLADLEAMLDRNVAAERAVGWRHVTLIHGDLDADEAARLEQLRRFADATGQLVATRGGNDYTTWIFRGPSAAIAQLGMLGRVEQLAVSWWRWSTDPMPRWAR